jgi:hypothetical protein
MNTNRTIDHAAQQQQPVTHRRPSQLNLTACGPSHTPAPYQQCALSAEHRGARTRAGRARAARGAAAAPPPITIHGSFVLRFVIDNRAVQL